MSPPIHHSDPSTRRLTEWRAALFVEIFLISIAFFVNWAVWNRWCAHGLDVCLGDNPTTKPLFFLGISLVRPFLLTPESFATYLAGRSFSTATAIVLSLMGNLLSTLPFFYIGRLLGRSLVGPWMASNLPQTLRLMKSQDYKIVFATRLIPLFPFDVMSLLYGAFTFRRTSVFIPTFLECCQARCS